VDESDIPIAASSGLQGAFRSGRHRDGILYVAYGQSEIDALDLLRTNPEIGAHCRLESSLRSRESVNTRSEPGETEEALARSFSRRDLLGFLVDQFHGRCRNDRPLESKTVP